MPTKRLTDQFVERVSAPVRGRVEYFDAAFPALSLRVSEHGHKSWSLFYRVNGNPKLRRYKLGIYPQVKPAKANIMNPPAKLPVIPLRPPSRLGRMKPPIPPAAPTNPVMAPSSCG